VDIPYIIYVLRKLWNNGYFKTPNTCKANQHCHRKL
jgi:hypothetical protein